MKEPTRIDAHAGGLVFRFSQRVWVRVRVCVWWQSKLSFHNALGLALRCVLPFEFCSVLRAFMLSEEGRGGDMMEVS
jgi:hypothetical protein